MKDRLAAVMFGGCILLALLLGIGAISHYFDNNLGIAQMQVILALVLYAVGWCLRFVLSGDRRVLWGKMGKL